VRWDSAVVTPRRRPGDAGLRYKSARTAAERNAMYYVVHRVLTSRAVFRMSMLVILADAFVPESAVAQQAPATQSLPQVISCVAKKGERQVCAADTAAGVALLRSTGESSCLLGKTWGYDDK